MFNEPSRKIPKNYRNITGKYSSSKSKNLISYESKLERDFLYLFDINNQVIKIVEQPLTIEYNNNNKVRRYTPDFYLGTPSGMNDIIVEVKYYDELKSILADEKYKYRAMKKHIEHSNVDFHIYTDRCKFIKSDEYKFNIHFLINYNTLPIEDLTIIQELFSPNITVQQLLDKYSKDQYKQLYLINSLWCMIRRNIILVDLFSKLSTNTKLLKLNSYDEELYKAHLDGNVIGGYLL